MSSGLLGADGRPLGVPQDVRFARLEEAVRVLATRLNAQFSQTIHLGIFTEWIAKQCEEQNVDMHMADFPAFAEEKYRILDERFAALEAGGQLAEGSAQDVPEISLEDTTELGPTG